MHRGPRSMPLCIQHHIELTSLSFQVSRPSHFWVTAILIFYLENPSSRSLTFYRLTSLSFHVNQPSHSWDKTFQNLTLKIQGQGHGRGAHWKSHHGSNILSTHTLFVPCQSAIPFIRYDFLKIWPWKSKVKVMGEGNGESHNMGPTFYRLISL